MSSLELDHDVLSVEDLLQAPQDLLVKAFLDLRAATEVLHDAVELGKTDDFAVGEIANVGHSTKKEEVVLTHGSERNVLLEDY